MIIYSIESFYSRVSVITESADIYYKKYFYDDCYSRLVFYLFIRRQGLAEVIVVCGKKGNKQACPVKTRSFHNGMITLLLSSW